MAIYRRGRTWWFSFIFEGRHIQQSTKQGNIKVARRAEAKAKNRLAEEGLGILEQEPAPLFADAMADFLKWSAVEHAAHPATTARYRTASVPLVAAFGKMRLDRITAQAVERYKQKRMSTVSPSTGRKLMPATVNRELAVVRKLMHQMGFSSPFGRVAGQVRLLKEDNTATRVLSYAEEEKYLSVASEPLRSVFLLMLETGMRPGEVYAIRKEHVDIAHGYLLVPSGKTASAHRRLTLSARAKAVLSMRLSADTKSPYVFPHRDDPSRHILKCDSAHATAVKRAGIAPAKLYAARHTYATRSGQSGIDTPTLSVLLGHRDSRMVARYVHPTAEHQAAAAQRIEAYTHAQRAAELEGLQRSTAVQ